MVRKFRESSKRAATRKLAAKPHRFAEIRHQDSESIIIPGVSSERRNYFPIGFLDSGIVVKQTAYVIYNAQPWLFSLLTSQMHMAWVRALAGRLKTDYRYSAVLCYNTFPVPELTEQQKHRLEQHAHNVLAERENHSEKTLGELYDPDKMPTGLKKAHEKLDLVVDQCYRSHPFHSDEERLEFLFKLYEAMLAKEKSADSQALAAAHPPVKNLPHKMTEDKQHRAKLAESVPKNAPWHPKGRKHG